MRRKDREVTDQNRISEIIRSCQCMRLALADGKSAYIVPVNFGYDCGQNAFYFHGAIKGRKIDLIRNNGYAGFEMDTDHQLETADEACGFSFAYSSIVGEGKIALVEDTEEKRHGLNCIMEHMAGSGRWEYPDQMLQRTAVIRLDVEEMCAKSNRSDRQAGK